VSRPGQGGAQGTAAVTFVLATTAGGTGRHVRSLAAGLTARGIEVCVAGPAATQRLLGFTEAGARFAPAEISDRPRPVHDLAAVMGLRRRLRGGQAGAWPGGATGHENTGTGHENTGTGHENTGDGRGVVHAHGLRAGALTALALGGLGRPSRRGRGPVFVVTLHNAPPAGSAGAGARAAALIYGVLERIVARRADLVLCVSADLATRMRRRGARSVGHAVVPAPPQPAVAPAAARAVRDALGADGRPVVLACGRLAPQKGFGTLLDAAARLRGRGPVPLVVVAGSGPLHTELDRRITAQRLPLRLLGQRDDVAALLAACDVFVLPSLWEGQPLILHEALRAGAVIVASRAGGIPDLTGEDAALLVPPGDPGRLAAALERVLTEPGLAKRLSAAAAERARSLPDEQAAVDAILASYHQAAGPPEPRA
jgi:glycosyltransferase involved in cell wall biosynthesis